MSVALGTSIDCKTSTRSPPFAPTVRRRHIDTTRIYAQDKSSCGGTSPPAKRAKFTASGPQCVIDVVQLLAHIGKNTITIGASRCVTVGTVSRASGTTWARGPLQSINWIESTTIVGTSRTIVDGRPSKNSRGIRVAIAFWSLMVAGCRFPNGLNSLESVIRWSIIWRAGDGPVRKS